MLFKDAITGENLYKKYVEYETITLYRDGFKTIFNLGFDVKAIVCDGK